MFGFIPELLHCAPGPETADAANFQSTPAEARWHSEPARFRLKIIPDDV